MRYGHCDSRNRQRITGSFSTLLDSRWPAILLMGVIRIERRSEVRKTIDLPLMVWGVDMEGERFLQEAHARDISLSGALLSGLDADLRSGDVIGILCGKRKARFRVVWIRYDGTGDKMQVAVHRIESDECPWSEFLTERSATNPPDELNAPSP